MAKKTYIAKHRVLLDAKALKYAEPGTRFQLEAAEGDRLVGLGACEDAPAEKKAPAAKKAPAKKPAPAADETGDDLV